MLVPFNALPIWLRTSRLRARECSVAIRGLWSLVSAPSHTALADTPRMLHDVNRTLPFVIIGTSRIVLVRRMILWLPAFL